MASARQGAAARQPAAPPPQAGTATATAAGHEPARVRPPPANRRPHVAARRLAAAKEVLFTAAEVAALAAAVLGAVTSLFLLAGALLGIGPCKAWAFSSVAFLCGALAAGTLVGADGMQRGRRGARAAAAARLASDAGGAIDLLRVLGLGDALRMLPAYLLDHGDGFERVAFLNAAISRVWPVVRAAAARVTAKELDEICGPYLEAYRPQSLRMLRVAQYEPGARPPTLAGIRCEPPPPLSATEAGGEGDGLASVEFTLDLRFVSDAQLTIEAVGPGGIKVSVTVSDVQIFGKMRMRLAPLLPSEPYVGAVTISFPTTPYLDVGLRVSGAHIPGLESAVRSLAVMMLEDMAVHPRQLIVPLAEGVDLSALRKRPVGIVYVRAMSVSNMPDIERLGLPDPYLQVYTRERSPSYTAIRHNTLNPVWGEEIMQFVVEDESRERVRFDLYDDELWRADRLVATATLKVSTLQPMQVLHQELLLTPADRFEKRAQKAAKEKRPGVSWRRALAMCRGSPLDFSRTVATVEVLYVPLRGVEAANRPATSSSALADLEPDTQRPASAPRLSLPEGWSLPPSGVLTVRVLRAEDLHTGVMARHPFVKLTLGNMRRKLPQGSAVSGRSGTYEWNDAVELVGVDPFETPSLLVRVRSKHSMLRRVPLLSHVPAFRKEFALGEVTIDLAPHAAAAQRAAGVHAWRISDTFALRGARRGSVTLDVRFRRNEEVAALRRRSAELLGEVSSGPIVPPTNS